MSHRIVAALVCACLAPAVAGVADAQTRRAPARSGTSAIAGRVFDAATNAPIRRAQIQGTSNDLFVDALSDEDGRFQLANLAAGEWTVTISKGGYFPWQPGQRRPFDQWTSADPRSIPGRTWRTFAI